MKKTNISLQWGVRIGNLSSASKRNNFFTVMTWLINLSTDTSWQAHIAWNPTLTSSQRRNNKGRADRQVQIVIWMPNHLGWRWLWQSFVRLRSSRLVTVNKNFSKSRSTTSTQFRHKINQWRSKSRSRQTEIIHKLWQKFPSCRSKKLMSYFMNNHKLTPPNLLKNKKFQWAQTQKKNRS